MSEGKSSPKKKASATFAVKPETPALALPEGTGYSSLYAEHYPQIHNPQQQQPQLHLHHDYYNAEHTQQLYNPYEHMQYFHPPPGHYYPMPGMPQVIEPQLEPEEQDQQLDCPHENCGKSFKKQSSYHQHLKTHTNTPKPFLCRICSFSFSRSHGIFINRFEETRIYPFKR